MGKSFLSLISPFTLLLRPLINRQLSILVARKEDFLKSHISDLYAYPYVTA
jgi:hypothetical protein